MTMVLGAREAQALRMAFALLADDHGEREIRSRLGEVLLDLLQADQFASFVWDDATGEFGDRVAINMDPANLDTYRLWHQHHDPITFALQARRHPTRVTEIMPQRALMRTPFFNDFLARDGLHWGMNLHAFDGNRALGDLRIWRRRQRGDFGTHHAALLSLIEPAFVAALRRARAGAHGSPTFEAAAPGASAGATRSPAERPLSAREAEVARCVAEGLTDKEIARRLGLALPTIRTYLRRSFEKFGVERRSALVARDAGRR